MKYFAVLKDSLRETADSKVLYVLFVLSTIAIGFVGTFSFKMLSAQKTMEQFFLNPKTHIPMIFLALNNHSPEKLDKENLAKTLESLSQYQLVGVELLQGEADSPRSDYALTIAHRGWGVVDDGKNPDQSREKVRSIFADAERLNFIQVAAIERLPADKDDARTTRYRVTIHGTDRTHRIWAVEPNIAFGVIPMSALAAPYGYALYILTKLVLGMGAWVAILMSVIITSFFIPNMLRKGTIDLLLAKPIHRWALLLYKYIGGLTFTFLCTAYSITGMWLVVGLRTGLWANGALLMIFTITFFFAILYAISTFVAVITRNTIASILVTIVAWGLFFGVGTTHEYFENRRLVEKAMQDVNRPVPADERWGDSPFAKAASILHAVMPRTSDLDYLDDMLVYSGFMTGSIADIGQFDPKKLVWWESLLVSSGWIVFFLTCSAVWFTFRDY